MCFSYRKTPFLAARGGFPRNFHSVLNVYCIIILFELFLKRQYEECYHDDDDDVSCSFSVVYATSGPLISPY